MCVITYMCMQTYDDAHVPAGCEYGDQVPWCDTYVQGVAECTRTEVAQYCCSTCVPYLTRTEPAVNTSMRASLSLFHRVFKMQLTESMLDNFNSPLLKGYIIHSSLLHHEGSHTSISQHNRKLISKAN